MVYGRGADLLAATFVERVAALLQGALAQGGGAQWSSGAMGDAEGLSNKRAANLLLLLAATYNLGLVQSNLVVELAGALAKSSGALELELLLLLLREVFKAATPPFPPALLAQ